MNTEEKIEMASRYANLVVASLAQFEVLARLKKVLSLTEQEKLSNLLTQLGHLASMTETMAYDLESQYDRE